MSTSDRGDTTRGDTTLMDLFHYCFSFVCGQNNCWYLAGQSLPVCQRCTGLYVGSACALVCWFVFRPRPSSQLLWLHGVFLLAMIPFGYHLIPQNGVIRPATGWLFAFGLVYYMATFLESTRRNTLSSTPQHAVIPTGIHADVNGRPTSSQHSSPHNAVIPTGVTMRSSVTERRDLLSPHTRRNLLSYLGCLTAGILALLFSVHLGTDFTARLLAILAAVGFLALASLTIITLLALVRDAVRRFSPA